MPGLTEEQWEASECLNKSKSSSFFSICTGCSKRLKDSSCQELCWGAPHPPCPSMKAGEPTIKEAFEEFSSTVKTTNHCTDRDVESALDLLNTSMSRCWECGNCEYWEAPSGGYEEAFITTHGVSWVSHEIPGFISFFIIRKCMMSESEKRRIYVVMSKLTDYLFEKGHVDAERKKEIKREITLCRSVNGEKIVRALQKLYDEGYWMSLERAVAEEEENDGEPTAKKQRTDDASDEEDFYSEEAEDGVGDELPMEVKEVTEDTWIFKKPCEYGGYRGYGSGDESDGDDDGIPVKLPEEVAKLGKKGMTISCMNLRCRRGVWSPYSPYDDSQVCANVYPPGY